MQLSVMSNFSMDINIGVNNAISVRLNILKPCNPAVRLAVISH